MRRIGIISGLIIFTGILQAQFLALGIQGGLNSSSVQVNNRVEISPDSKYSLDTYNSSVGFQVGLFARVNVWKLFVQPSIHFSTVGGEVKVSDLVNNTYVIKSQKFNKINIPVLAGLKTGPLRLQVGPVASFMLSKPDNLLDVTSYKEDFHKATIGYQAGIGFDIFKKITLDLCYEGNLSRLGNGIKVDGVAYPFDSRTSQWMLNIGFIF